MASEQQIPPPEVTVVDSHRVWCDGSGQIRSGPDYRAAALGHPRVYLQIDEKGWVECGYCDRRFVLRGGPDTAGIDEVFPGDLQDHDTKNQR